MKPKLLFHICCGICFLSYLDFIKDYDATIFFYNPNVHPEEEYRKRLDSIKKIAKNYNFPIIEGEYNKKDWFHAVKGLEQEPENGNRCKICFELRLKETVKFAKENGFTHFSTTLNLSPYKDIIFINKLSNQLAQENNLQYLEFNFDKQERFELLHKAMKLAHSLNLYHQKYCGCLYSI